jgi:hypothetical protein
MNWDAIGAIGELVGAAAVVGTLFYLAIQIRLSNRFAERQSRQELISSNIQFHEILVSNPELVSIRLKLEDINSEYTPEEQLKIHDFIGLVHAQSSIVGADYEYGFIDERILTTYFRAYANFIDSYPGVKLFWLDRLDNQIEVRSGFSKWWDLVRAKLTE